MDKVNKLEKVEEAIITRLTTLTEQQPGEPAVDKVYGWNADKIHQMSESLRNIITVRHMLIMEEGQEESEITIGIDPARLEF